jgi:adenine/guanine phosphoribosyltransferase-like PRPP-binding protein
VGFEVNIALTEAGILPEDYDAIGGPDPTGVPIAIATAMVADVPAFATRSGRLVGGIQSGSRVVLVDDLLATGGTASAAASLVRKVGGKLLEVTFLIELEFLKGRQRLNDVPVRSIVRY